MHPEAPPSPAPTRPRRTRRTTRLVFGVALFLLVYGAIIGYRGNEADEELFPFFSWDLFSRVPAAESGDYSVRLTTVAGRRLDPPVYFDEAGKYISTSHNPEAYVLFQNLGKQLEAKNLAGSIYAVGVLNSRYLQQVPGARYEVVRRRFNLLERSDCRNCFTRQDVIGRFTVK